MSDYNNTETEFNTTNTETNDSTIPSTEEIKDTDLKGILQFVEDNQDRISKKTEDLKEQNNSLLPKIRDIRASFNNTVESIKQSLTPSNLRLATSTLALAYLFYSSGCVSEVNAQNSIKQEPIPITTPSGVVPNTGEESPTPTPTAQPTIEISPTPTEIPLEERLDISISYDEINSIIAGDETIEEMIDRYKDGHPNHDFIYGVIRPGEKPILLPEEGPIPEDGPFSFYNTFNALGVKNIGDPELFNMIGNWKFAEYKSIGNFVDEQQVGIFIITGDNKDNFCMFDVEGTRYTIQHFENGSMAAPIDQATLLQIWKKLPIETQNLFLAGYNILENVYSEEPDTLASNCNFKDFQKQYLENTVEEAE